VLGQRGGETAHTLIVPELAAHIHVPVANSAAADAATPDPSGGKVLGASSGRTGSPGQPLPAHKDSPGEPTLQLQARCVSTKGGNQPHENMSPYLVLNVVIALQGIFPSQN